MTSAAFPGREPVQIVEIVQPFCTLTHGTAPCTATETGDAKCFNTRATCNDPANFTRGTMSLFFARGNVADRLEISPLTTSDGLIIRTSTGEMILTSDASSVGYILPSLVSVSTQPSRINLAGSNPDSQAIGTRAICNIQFADHPHTDRKVDPYLADRTYDPMTRGSFWAKWMRRNLYRVGMVVRVYEGYWHQDREDMRMREYIISDVTGPDSNGSVTVRAKDVLALIEERKAQAPVASKGELYADIGAAAMSFEVTGAATSDYSASGTVRIGDELLKYSSVASSANGITFTVSARGTDGSTADGHSAEDAVQECLRYTNKPVNEILEDLLANYGGIPPAYLDTAGWADEASAYLSAYNLTALVTKPESVQKLASELQEQALFYLWWDEHARLIKFRSVRAIDGEPDILTDENHIIAGSFSIMEMPRQRASQVWISYRPKDWSAQMSDTAAFLSTYIAADLESEGADFYGSKSVRSIYSRWLPTRTLAFNTSSKIIARYSDVPRGCKFQLDAKDREAYGVGDAVRISHFADVDETGAKNTAIWTITSVNEIIPGEIVEYEAEDTTIFGKVYVILPGGAADYDPDTSPYNGAYIGDASGLLSNGDDCARIT